MAFRTSEWCETFLLQHTHFLVLINHFLESLDIQNKTNNSSFKLRIKKATPLPSPGKGAARTYHYFYLIKTFTSYHVAYTVPHMYAIIQSRRQHCDIAAGRCRNHLSDLR